MKKSFTTVFLLLICLSFTAFQCDDDDLQAQEEELAELNRLKSEIETLASTSVCNEATECKSIGFGSKPCGGYWSYLIYSTSINTDKLEALVENYNTKESTYNQKWGIVSDCALVTPPIDIKCENNSCVAVF